MSGASAPGKFILFGEHAVVFGKPAFALAIDRRLTVTVAEAERTELNGKPFGAAGNSPYVEECLRRVEPQGHLRLETRSTIPAGSGLGSSAAAAIATLAALDRQGRLREEDDLARAGFEVELAVQGRASPLDTSTVTHGSGILVSPERLSGHLWEVRRGEKVWNLHHRSIPEADFVVGFTGISAATGPLVAMVHERAAREPKVREAIEEIGELTLAGVDALQHERFEEVGELMERNHALLTLLGVGHERLDALLRAVKPYALGAKLTGAGGGGSIVALTEKPDKAAEAIRAAGGTPIPVRLSREGVRRHG